MKIALLFVYFLGISKANKCKYWKRSTTTEDQRRIGTTLFLVKTSGMYKCSMRCYGTEDCAIFSYDQPTGNCTGFKKAISSNPTNVYSSGTFFFNDALYTVTINTGTHQDAGTDARVFLTIYGSFGSTEEIELVDDTYGKQKFDRESTDVFDITSFDIGELQKIKIRHDRSGHGSGWIVKTIIISKNREAGITFSVNNWIVSNNQPFRISYAP